MALIHRATISPTKEEIVAAYLPTRSWVDGRDVADPNMLGAYRFDDPDGEVGIETLLVEAGGAVFQVPLTYRGAPLDGVEPITTMEHSVLGPRWVYDGTVDPAYVAALATAILSGGVEAEELVDSGTDGGERTIERREPTARVQGTGAPGAGVDVIPEVTAAPTVADEGASTTITAGDLRLVVHRVVDDTRGTPDVGLTGSWRDHSDEVTLAEILLD